VRDVSVFGIGQPLVVRPSTIEHPAGPKCDDFACPFLIFGFFPYQGPMGYEGHCESHIASTANWDLTQSLITAHGTEPGWAAMEELWYGSLTATKSAYQVVSGGQCNPSAVVNGCGAQNWYTVYLAVDDDDGNLANGTPNGCRIWDAFDAHGIACGTRPACFTCTPTATADAGPDQEYFDTPVTIGTPALPDHTYSWSPGGETTAQITVAPEITTVYTVTASTTCGSDTDSVTVTVENAVANPGFETAGAWVLSGDGVQRATGAVAFSGNAYMQMKAARRGGGGTVHQNVSPPVDAQGLLTFRLNVVSTTADAPLDELVVEVMNAAGTAVLDELARFSNADRTVDDDYLLRGPYDVSAFSGQEVRLRFRIAGSNTQRTIFRLDNVSWR
jgi:hypothetical protein